MTNRFVLAALAGMLTIAVMGGVLYGVIFARFFHANIINLGIMKTPPAFGWIALSHVPFGILLALVVRWRGDLSARGGAIAGAVLGFLMAMSYNLAQFGTVEHWTLQLTLVEPFITMTMVGTAGAVVGGILAREAPSVRVSQ
ncbi:MAG: DUF2177 family protein [Pyrinomonadaceae bacterium]